MNETEQTELSALKAELRQSEADAERWRLLSERFQKIGDEFAQRCQQLMKMYDDAQRLAQEKPSADALAEGSEFHQWFLRNVD